MNDQTSQNSGEETVSHQPRIPQGTRVPNNLWFQSGLPSGEYLRESVYDRVTSSWRGHKGNQGNEVSRCASKVADVLTGLEDATITGRSARSFEEIIDLCTALVQSIVAKCYMEHGKNLQDESSLIEAISGDIVNEGLTKMESDIRLEFTTQGFLIKDRGIGIPQFPGNRCIWDDLGLRRETDTPGQSWNPNGMSTFFHKLKFSDYRYWDAIYWRNGYLDRQQSVTGYPDADQVRYGFVDQISNAIEVDRLDRAEVRAKALADHSDKRSLWFRVARQWHMRDHMILVFETTRTRSVDLVNLPGKHDLRNRYHSSNPQIAADARSELLAWATGTRLTIPDIEAVLGRPYYELMYGVLDIGIIKAIQQSVDITTNDIINEAVQLMAELHVRPYIFWTSETELMIAAARPGSNRGPWNRQDIEKTAPLISAVHGVAIGSNNAGLMEWSNARRTAYEPECDWNTVAADDAQLDYFLSTSPDLHRLLDSESWTDDDQELMKRLIRLGRFGYGFPQVRKPEYRDVHILP